MQLSTDCSKGPQTDVTVAAPAADDRWLRELIIEHGAVLHRVAIAWVGPDLADDVVSETFAAAWTDRGSYDVERGGELAWLVGITLRRCHTLRRAERRWQKRQLSEANRAATDERSVSDATEDAAERVDAARRRHAVLKAVGALPTVQRAVLLLVADASLTPAEVAVSLGLEPSTVRSHLLRARRAVSMALDSGEVLDAAP